MAAYDNVSLPGAPDIARAGNYAQMLMQGLSNIPEAYYKGQEQRYQARQRDFFQDPDNASALQDALKTGSYTPLLQKLLQAGGTPAMGQVMPLLQAQAGAGVVNNAFGGGGSAPAAAPSSPNGAGPANLAPAPSAPTGAQPQLSATGADSAGADTLNSLAAEHHVDLDAFLAKYPGARGLLNRDLTPGQVQGVTQRMAEFNSGAAGQPQGLPVGAAGGAPISPTPTAAMGGSTPQRGAPAAPGGAVAAPIPGAAPAAVPSFDERFTPEKTTSGAPSLEEIARYERSGMNKLRAAGSATVNQAQAMTLRDAGNKELEIAKQLREQRAKFFEPTPEQKNVASGAEERKGQIAADTKYYDSLHRGLAGSGMIAAQQKQNIDVLRQIAASPSFTPGAGSGLAVGYQRILAQLGINPRGAAPREVFNQLAARVLADQFSGIKSLASETGEQGARIFKPMLDIEDRANITHEDSLEGVKSKLNLLDRTGDLMMKWADMADDYKIRHGRLDAGFDKELRGEIGKARVSNAMAPAMPRFDTREEAALWARREGIRPGEPVRLPSGKVINAP